MMTATRVETIPPITRAEVEALARTEYRRVADQLRSLTGDDWSKPTDCPLWDVRAIAGHSSGMLSTAGGQQETWRMGYLFDVILTRDPWMHRVDTAHATGHQMELTPEHDGRIIADVVAEWAHRHGRPFTLTLTGPAGGEYVAGENGEHITVDAAWPARPAGAVLMETHLEDGTALDEGITETEYDALLGEMALRCADGRFLAVGTMYVVVSEKAALAAT